jgi:hypothetical protein
MRHPGEGQVAATISIATIAGTLVRPCHRQTPRQMQISSLPDDLASIIVDFMFGLKITTSYA